MSIEELYNSYPEVVMTRAIFCEMVCGFSKNLFDNYKSSAIACGQNIPFTWADAVEAYNYLVNEFGLTGYVELRDVYRISIGARGYNTPSNSYN